jgi:hypothetical protein
VVATPVPKPIDDTCGRPSVDWKLDVAAVPVSDVDRGTTFHTEAVSFNADHGHTVS